jgi:amino-acid N-acetyltransferase
MPPAVSVRRATRADRGSLAALLDAAGLPTDAVGADDGRFYAGRLDGDVVCGGGLELHGSAALVRSVVVADDYRGRGFGGALCDELEAAAERAGATTASLLTTTAAEYFERRGYRPVAREDAPRAVRQTSQFADVCPSTATYMEKNLE